MRFPIHWIPSSNAGRAGRGVGGSFRHGALIAALAALLWTTAPLSTAFGADGPSRPTIGLSIAGELDGGSQGFISAELYLRLPLPWRTHWGGWAMESDIQTGIAWLRIRRDSGQFIATGPLLSTTSPGGRWYGELGSRAALITNRSVGNGRLGTPLEFISHGEVGLIAYRYLRLGFRIQHISNAGLSDRNSGLNVISLHLRHKL